MPFRPFRSFRSIRRSSTKSKAKLSLAAAVTCEPLEPRQLMTALVNGRFSGTNSAYDGLTYFEYRQANGNATIRISVFGNITAEFVGARYNQAMPGLLEPADLIPAATATSDVFLFQIYVVKADANSVISISSTAATGQAARPMTPFTGGMQMRILNASGTGATPTQLITTTDGTAYIGALTPATLAVPGNSIPLIAMSLPVGLGMRPATGRLYAGLESAKGNNLGKFFLGGTITGRVSVQGSMDTFYAGNIYTGDAAGLPAQDNTTGVNFPENNFYIQGDIHNILCANSIGTITLANTPTPASIVYKSGFQLKVGGRVGQIYQDDSFLGQILISDDPRSVTPGGAQHEIEARGADLSTLETGDIDPSYFDPFFYGYDISIGGTTPDVRFNNDTFATAQYLGSAYSAILKSKTGIDLQGALRTFGTATNAGGGIDDSDTVDYYAVALLAGQSIDVQLADELIGLDTSVRARLGVFDPDGRLIATNYSKFKDSARLAESIRITADRPGAYRIAIADFGDINFNGAADAGESVITTGTALRYELKVRNVGDLALGGLIANLSIATMDRDAVAQVLDRGIEVLNGDIGAIRSGVATTGALQGTIFSLSLPWKVANGNFRSMEATSMGIVTAGVGTTPGFYYLESGPDFVVSKGSIGLLRTTGLATPMMINDNLETPVTSSGLLYPSSTSDLSLTPRSLAAGRDIQLVDCAGTFEGALLANRAIGVIRAGRIGGLLSPNAGGVGAVMTSPVIQANVDKIGNDGVIDLIDVSGNAQLTGDIHSAAIMTGPGGNVRYIRVTGTAYRDFFFGGASTAEQTIYNPGSQAVITDDSGTQVVLTPLPRDPVSQFPRPVGSPSGFLDPAMLTVLTYPIRGTSGKVIVRVGVSAVDDTTDGIVRPGGGGLQVDASASGAGGSAEIGEIQLGVVAPAGFTAGTATGNPFTFNAFTGSNAGIAGRSFAPNVPPLAPAQPTRDLNLIFQGSATIDVWNINPAAVTATINNIRNTTVAGEIVNILGTNVATNVFSLTSDYVGIAKKHTGAAVNGAGFGVPTPTLDNTYPFVQQRNLIRVGNLASVSARRSLGNILSSSNIGSITANSDGVDVPREFEGIAGPIVVRGTGNGLTGNLVSVNIGEGLLPSGSGEVGFAGIYVTNGVVDFIGGNKADIRGDIVAGGTTLTRVQQQATDINGNLIVNPDGSAMIITTPVVVIGINLTNGSIIDADIMNAQVAESREGVTSFTPIEFLQGDGFENPIYDIGSIQVGGIGGIIGAVIESTDIGSIQVLGGFGLINSLIDADGGSVLQGITADGYGIRDCVISAGSILGISAPGTGKLATTTGYSGSVRYSEKTTVEPYSGRALSALNDLHKALGTTARRARITGISETGVIMDSQITGTRTLGNVNVQKIVAMKTTRVVDAGSGRRERIPFGDQQYPMRFSFANSIGDIVVRDSIIGLGVSTGSISNLIVGRDVASSRFDISGRITKIWVNRVLSSSAFNVTGPDGRIDYLGTRSTLLGAFDVALDIGTLSVGTDLGSKLLRTGRNIGSFLVNGSVITGARINVGRGTISTLAVGKDVKAGAVIRAHQINSQTVKGQVIGDIIVV